MAGLVSGAYASDDDGVWSDSDNIPLPKHEHEVADENEEDVPEPLEEPQAVARVKGPPSFLTPAATAPLAAIPVHHRRQVEAAAEAKAKAPIRTEAPSSAMVEAKPQLRKRDEDRDVTVGPQVVAPPASLRAKPVPKHARTEEEKATIKDKERLKRMKGQSTHATWKSETEMQLRQTYD
eukprot:jgi/Mesvir1/18949/Mv18918-RA.1